MGARSGARDVGQGERTFLKQVASERSGGGPRAHRKGPGRVCRGRGLTGRRRSQARREEGRGGRWELSSVRIGGAASEGARGAAQSQGPRARPAVVRGLPWGGRLDASPHAPHPLSSKRAWLCLLPPLG